MVSWEKRTGRWMDNGSGGRGTGQPMEDGWVDRRMDGLTADGQERAREHICRDFLGSEHYPSVGPAPFSVGRRAVGALESVSPSQGAHLHAALPPAPLWAGVKLAARRGSAQSSKGAPAPGALDQPGL